MAAEPGQASSGVADAVGDDAVPAKAAEGLSQTPSENEWTHLGVDHCVESGEQTKMPKHTSQPLSPQQLEDTRSEQLEPSAKGTVIVA